MTGLTECEHAGVWPKKPKGMAPTLSGRGKHVDQLVTWVAGVERSEPPEIADPVASLRSTTATQTSSTYFFADA